MSDNVLPHNELVWWRMTKKQKYLPGRVVVLELEADTVGIDDEDEQLLKKLLKPGYVIVNSFDDMKYAVCSSGNVRLYPTISEDEQRALEKDCIKSSKTNYRAMLRIKKILELRKLDQVQYVKNESKIPIFEVNMINFFKGKDSHKALSESIDFFERNTAIEIIGSIVDSNSLKNMIGQSNQAFSYLQRSLSNENEAKRCISFVANSQTTLQEIDSKNWKAELNEIIVNRKTIYELLSCVPFELLSKGKNEANSFELNEKIVFTAEWEESICNWLDIKCSRNQRVVFTIEYLKLSILYLQILSKTVALRVVNRENNVVKDDRSNYRIVLSVGGVFGDPYDINISSSFFSLRNLGTQNCKKKHRVVSINDNKPTPDVHKSIKKISKIEKANSHSISFCFKTTSELYQGDKSLFYKVDLTRISSQLVLSEELNLAYDIYCKEFNIKDLEARSKAFHKIKSSCPIMIKLLREFLYMGKGADFDLTYGIEQIKKIKEDFLILY